MTTAANKCPLVVVADDDQDDLLLLEDAFKEANIAIRMQTVPDGVELLRFLCDKGGLSENFSVIVPDLIICDINMPRMDGFEALAKIRGIPHFRDIPFVTFTSSQDEADRSQALATGATDHIVKPYRFDELLRVVRNLSARYLVKL